MTNQTFPCDNFCCGDRIRSSESTLPLCKISQQKRFGCGNKSCFVRAVSAECVRRRRGASLHEEALRPPGGSRRCGGAVRTRPSVYERLKRRSRRGHISITPDICRQINVSPARLSVSDWTGRTPPCPALPCPVLDDGDGAWRGVAVFPAGGVAWRGVARS